MRAFVSILLLTAVVSAYAEDITLRDGRVFKNATVTNVTPAYVTVTHSAGVARVMLQDLPPELQTRYDYDKEKAAKFAAADAAAQRQIAQQQLAEQQQAAAEEAARQQASARDIIAKNTHTIREVSTDQLSFLDKPFIVECEIELSSYYDWGYKGAEPTHFSFELRSADGSCHLYMERSKASALRKRLVDNGGALKELVLCRAPQESLSRQW